MQLSKVNGYAVCQSLRSATGHQIEHSPSDPIAYLEDLLNEGLIRLPCEINNVFLVQERLPIFTEINRSVQTSILLRQLLDRYADTGLVVDALLSGKNGLFFATLVESASEARRWVDRANAKHVWITIKTIDDAQLVLANLASYVFNDEEY